MGIEVKVSIDRVESLIEFLSVVYNETTEKRQDIEAEPRDSYSEEKRKSKRQELRKLDNIRNECSTQYYWNSMLKYMKRIEAIKRS